MGIALTLTGGGGEQLDRTSTDAASGYRLVPPADGTYLLICVASDFRPAAHTATISGMSVRRDLALVGAGRVSGTVRSGGRPVPAARITLMDDSGEIVGATASDGAGRYLLDDLHSGEHTLTVTADRHRPQVSSVTVPAHERVPVDVDLVAVAEVVGTVRATSDRRPLPEARVTLVDGAGAVVAPGVTDERGSYRFADVAPGPYTVTASTYGPVAAHVEVGSGTQRVSDLGLGWDAAQR